MARGHLPATADIAVGELVHAGRVIRLAMGTEAVKQRVTAELLQTAARLADAFFAEADRIAAGRTRVGP